MNYKYMTQKIIPEDVPETYQPIVSLVGLEGFLKLCKYSSGDRLYFPMVESIYRNARKRMILKEYNGYNKKELSEKYALSITQTENIIKGSQEK